MRGLKVLLSISHKRTVAYVLTVVGVFGIVTSVWLLRHSRTVSPSSGSQSQNAPSGPSSVHPSQKAIDTYSVAADAPKYISIPTINVSKTRVMSLGVMKNNEIATPDNIHDTGWYNRSAKPGQNGAMFIFGHVSNWQANGVFYDLKKLKAGDRVAITRGDNKTFTYQVVSSKVYPHDKVDMDWVLSPINPGKPELNLMTCTGKVIKGTSEFDERLVVFTSLVKD